MLGRFIFKLRHPLQDAQRGDGIKYPGELEGFHHVRLNKHRTPFRIQPAGHTDHCRVQGGLQDRCSVIVDGDGVVIYNAINAVVLRYQLYPVTDGA